MFVSSATTMETMPRHSSVSHSLEFGFHGGCVSPFFEAVLEDGSLGQSSVLSAEKVVEAFGTALFTCASVCTVEGWVAIDSII